VLLVTRSMIGSSMASVTKSFPLKVSAGLRLSQALWGDATSAYREWADIAALSGPWSA
jgi:hypothetical protein